LNIIVALERDTSMPLLKAGDISHETLFGLVQIAIVFLKISAEFANRPTVFASGNIQGLMVI
jgi:hypothetical protein